MSPRFPSNRALVVAATAAGAVATAAAVYYVIKRHCKASQRAAASSPECRHGELQQTQQEPLQTQSRPSYPRFSLCISEGYETHQEHNRSPPCTPALCHLRTHSLLNGATSHSLQTCNWLQQPQHDISTACTRQFPWVVFWDLENVKIPSSLQPATFIHALRNALRTTAPTQSLNQTPPILRFIAVTNVHATPLKVRTALQSNGISLLHVDSQTRKDACDKALITELCLLPREHSPPMGVALLSNDVDFAYPLARLAALGYHTVVVTPRIEMISRTLATVPRTVLTFDNILTHVPSSISPHSALQSSNQPMSTRSTSDHSQQQNHRQPSRSSRNSRKHIRQQQNEKRSPQRAKQTQKSSPKRSAASSNAASFITKRNGKQPRRDEAATQQKVSDKVHVQFTKSSAQSPESPSSSARNSGNATYGKAPTTSEQGAASKVHVQPQKRCAKSSAASSSSKGKPGNETASEKRTPKKQRVQPQKRSAKSCAAQSSSTVNAGTLRRRNAACSQQNVSNNARQPSEQQPVRMRTRHMQRLSVLHRRPVYILIVFLLCFLIIFRGVRDHLWAQRWLQGMRMSW
ncbi:hypothetical protein BWQ96_01773 [Gracilariopsis chorda]|uniref:NYN domain-containing protein n=1 Tax=Gracilariopsis chorda TaxID=448386 RepID=A0A2V3J1W1_9FLOR|nr:hypothetical protein BWQ96_01773 [Gracilariopsis chorda]|eukprot:PXF48313.1 hypothetical protein BWQ96_01773 [Gracilariopsis chorda]